jgi:hypothetical protein
MMFRDPFTGDIDIDAFLRLGIIALIVCIFATLGSVSEGENWYYPYVLVVDYLSVHATFTIGAVMILIMSYWWYEQFRGGYF